MWICWNTRATMRVYRLAQREGACSVCGGYYAVEIIHEYFDKKK